MWRLAGRTVGVVLLFGGLALVSCLSLEGFSGGAPDAARPSDAGDSETISDGGAPVADEAGLNTSTDAAPSAYAMRILADKPIGYWRFDETSGTRALDSSGHGHHATYGANVVLGHAGLVGDGFAARFDGSQDAGAEHFVLVPESAGLEPASWVTIECWVLTFVSDTTASIVSYGSDGPAPFEPYVLWISSGVPQGYIVTANGSQAVVSSGPITSQQSHHLVVVYDGSALQLYIDGSSVATAPATGTLTNYDVVNGLGIGSAASATRNSFAGVIDEVAVYQDPLSSRQIAEHYALGRAR